MTKQIISGLLLNQKFSRINYFIKPGTLIFCTFILVFLAGNNLLAQNYPMANGTITTCSGNFKDPGNNGQYANNSNFAETFCSGVAGQCISVTFTSFNLDNGFDFLYIYDGASSAQNPIGVFTGATLPGTFTSSSGCLTFVFTSDNIVTAPGWVATISCGPCNSSQNYVMTNVPIIGCSGTFYDPGGTNNYSTSTTYTQTICSGVAGQCISLFFSQFSLELNYDYLTIYDGPTTGSTLIGTYTGTNTPGTVTASSGCITLVFTSDISNTDIGWAASISCGACGVVNTNCGCPAGGTPPVNDNCSGAINLGSLPTPAACPNGVGTAITTQGTTNCATAPANFAYQTGCQPAGNQPWPAADVWYQVTVTGTELHIQIPGGGMQSPSVAIYQGSNCNNLIPRGCAIGNAAGLNTTFAPVAPGTYWIQVSGGNLNDQCDFSMTVWNNLDCAGCVLGSNLTVNPPPVNGYYQPNTVVNFCFTVTNYNQTSDNWLHGVVPTFGSGWNLGSLSVVPAANCGADDAGTWWVNSPGVWSWYNSVTSTATGATYGPGFFFEQPQPVIYGDPANPGDNFGDNGYLTTLSTTGSCTWTFCWTITTQPNCTSGADLNVDINTLGDGESGGWASIGCTGDPNPNFNATMQCCLPPSVNTSPPTCNQTNGSASALGDGTGPWTYDWFDAGNNLLQTDPTVNGSASIGNLASGNYYVIVTDAAGCSTITDFTIVPSSSLTLSTTHINVPCSGASTGSINLNVISVNAPFTYLWSNGFVTEDLANLSIGNYSVTVTDNTGCSGTTSVAIAQLTSPTVALTPINVLCNGGSTGSISSLVNGGSAPYIYHWSTGAVTANLTSLSIGSYSITVTDANGCTAIAIVTITQPNPNVVTLEHQDITCGNDDGEAAVDNITGGGGPFTYLWSTGANTIQIDNLPPGTYSVTVTNSAGCTSSASVTLVAISFPVLSELHVNTTCGNINGSINVSVVGGTAPFSYLWSNGSITQDLNGVGAGTYSVTVTDVNGCTDDISVTLTNSNGPTLSVSSVNPLCFGYATGSINITVNGGVAPFSYIWNNGAITQDINNVLSGLYFVTVTDANGCSIIQGVILADGATINLSAIPVDVKCFGAGTGSIDLTVAGGTAPYFYLWSNGAITQDLNNLLAGNYFVTVTDGNGCTAIANTAVNQPPPIAFSNIITNATCVPNSGAINITVNGGNPPYTFLWSNGANTEDLTGINSGTYDVTILDANFCSYTWTGVVVAPVSQTLSAIHINTTCGLTNGSIDLAVVGGTAPFIYSWSNGAATQDLINIAAGNYIVTVTDNNGCTATLPVTITDAAPTQTLSETHINATCGLANGSINLTVAGGTAPFIYLWSNGFVTEDIANIASGTYNVTVTDNIGCTATIVATLFNSNGSTLSETHIDATCGLANGSINLTVAGGTAPFIYLWSNGFATEDLANIAAGNYTVTVTDNNGCTATLTATLFNSNGSTLSETHIDATCGLSNGSIDLTVVGGTAPFIYLWSNGFATEDLANIAAGNYTVTVTDNNGCTATLPITITDAPAQTLSETHINATCGLSNGSINLTVTGGTAPFIYLWSNGFATEDLANIAAGNYIVTVTDNNGCTATLTATLFNSNGSTLSETHIDATCGLANGSINLTIVGGTAPFIYLWSNGFATEDLTNIAAGSYTTTVTDANGCTATLTITITDAPAQTLTETHTNTTCGLSNGSINLTVTGGTAPFIYLWSNGFATEDLANIAAGNYTVTVTDNNGCTATLSVTITDAPAQTLNETHINATCGLSNGSINLTVTDGTAPFIYLWSNGFATEDLANIAAGNYTVTVTDNNGCTATLTATLFNSNGSTLSETHIDATCGLSNGSIDLTVVGGTAPFIYLWSNGFATEDLANIAAGNYTVTVTDNNGCTATLPITITDAPAQTLSETHINATCGLSNGSIDLTVVGGTAPFIYLWSNGFATEDLANIAAGNYIVTVTDNNGCTATLSVTITDAPAQTLNETHINATCGLSNGSINLTVTGGTAPFIYLWSNGFATEDLANIAAGNYTVTVTDNNGCTATLTATLFNSNGSTLSETHIDATCGLSNGSIDLTVVGGTAPFIYLWSNGFATEDLANIAAGNYTVTVTDNNGCTATLPVIILNIGNPTNSIQAISICLGQSFVLPDGSSVSFGGIYIDTIFNSNNCDSIITTNLTINPLDFTSENLTSCNPADTGIVSTTYTNQFGCDSVHTVITTFLLSDSTFQNLTSCNPADTGIVSTTYNNQFGCDSVHTVKTTLLQSDATSETLTSCDPSNVGVVVTTYTNQYGCDSVHTVTTTLLLSDSTFQNLTSCNPADTGIVSTTYTNQYGCDSVHTVTTTFLLSDSTFQNLTSCNPADTGIVSTTYSNQFGCDSVHTVTTTFLLSDSTFQNLTSCNPADTGVVATTYTNQFGCDSVHTVTTTFLLSDSTFQNLTSCNPADTGIVSTTYTNQFGCDSVHTVITTYLLSDSTFQNLTSCNPADTGTVSTTYSNQFGCDSVHTVTTTFLLSDSTFQNLTSCNPADTGTVSTTYINQFGCDSVHTVITTFLLSDSTFQNLTSCNPADTGTVSTTYTNQFGCDSVHTVITTYLLSDSTFQNLTSCNPADTGTVSTTYINQFGCDSVHTVITTFLLSDSTFQNLTSCNPADTGIVSTTYTNQFGCDSVHTVITTYLLSDSTFQNLTSCNPADTGIVSTTYNNQFGCDSVHTVKTTLLQSDATSETLTSCDPSNVGVVVTTYTNQYGCDSVHTVTTTLLLSDSTFQNLTSCNPADTGIVSTTYSNQFGCDSVHTVTTTYLLSDSTFQNLTSCNPADTGVVSTTYTNQFGCDSVHTVTTTFLLSDSTFQNLTSCNPADTGIVSTTYTNQFGCDSVHTVITTYLLSDSTFQNLTSCNPADTGTVSTTYSNQFGCDSVHTVTTTFLLSDSTFQNLTSCNPADTGIVSTTYTNQFGCDSVHTVTTTLLLSDSTFQNLTSCNPTDTGIVSTTYINQFGCDSVHTIITTYLLSDSTFQNLTSCNPADTGIVSTTYTNQFGCDSVHTVITTFLLSDSTFQNLTSCNPADTGIVSTTYTNQFGCDSVHTVITTFLLSDSTFQNLTSCNPADTGIVSTTYTNQFGCDSVHTVTTTFLLSDSTFQNLTSCNPADTGIVSTTYTNQFGCDSVHTVTTTFLLSDSTFQNLTSCNPADTGVVSTTYTNQFGCDSVHTVTTTFLLSDSTFQNLTSCNPADTGIVSTTYTNQFGCDSVHTVITTFLVSDSTFQNLTSCNPADTGTVSTTYTNQFGCDSVHTVTITFLLSDSTFQNLTSCNPSDTGIVSTTYTNQFGCDSVHTVITTFLVSDSTFQNITSCNPADTGVVSTTYTNQFGCDSVHTVTTTLLPSQSTTITDTICSGQNYTLPDGTSTSSAGQYIITLTAANSCDSIITTNLTVSNPAITETHINGTCGNANGSINITPMGGVGIYTFQWSTGATTEDISNLNTGNYDVTVTDAFGCSATLTINITNSTTPLMSETHINTLCGQSTGSIDLTVIGGTAPYNYLWSNAATTEDLIGLGIGTYTVTVTDANGCTGTLTIDITCTPPPPCLLTVSATGTNNSCFNSCDGSINIVVNNATGAIIYNWSNGATTQNINSLCIGTYSVIVSDANGCVDSATVTITEPTQLTVSATPTDAGCFNSSTGSITSNASGGTINYTYQWSNGQTTPNISLLTANNYSVTVTDNNGCTATANATVNQPLQIQLSTIVTDESCGNANGQIDLTVTNGVAAFSYNWSNAAITQDIQNLPANTYTVTVTDANNCTATTTATVQNTPPPTVTVSANPTTICVGDNTTITASGASTYVWTPSTTLNQSTGAVVIATPTITTTYTVTGTAANGCANDTTIIITVNPIPVVTVNNATICIGDQTNLTANGATTYSWSPNTNLNQTTGQTVIANPTTTITYTVTGTTAGCSSTATAVVTVNPLPTLTTNITDTSICINSNATLIVNGASTYSWTPNNGLANTTAATQVANPTITTTYTITGTNANGCTNTATITVNINPLPIVTVTPPQGICPGQTAQLTAAGADTYTWSPSTSLDQSTGATVNSTPTTNITYIVTGTNAATGCVNTATTNITINVLPVITINPNPAFICVGDNINLTASGASTYSWNPNSGLNTTVGATVNATPTTTTTYTIIGTTVNGCVDSTTSIVTVGQYAVVDIFIGPTEGCEPLTVYFSNNTTGAANYVWNFGDNTSSSDTSPTHTYSTGTYYPSIVITSTTGCVTTINPLDTIWVHPLPIANFTSNPDFGITTILEYANYEFTNHSSGADFYQWLFGDGTGDTTVDATHTYTASGNYDVTLIATTQYGCADTLTRTPIVIIDEPSLWIPNTFTPNGDGLNDFFGIYGTSIKSYHMKIFDRWGEMIFENNDYFPTWDGLYHGMPLNVGVYVYLVQVDFKDGTTMWRKGDVTLIR